ncbi:MAG: hypothetical protein CMJ78_23445 [Planctomycetaceae bacterium]|nr:hypothetical protein [Planctomycetaceae bacterium]
MQKDVDRLAEPVKVRLVPRVADLGVFTVECSTDAVSVDFINEIAGGVQIYEVKVLRAVEDSVESTIDFAANGAKLTSIALKLRSD